jgi:20S proteasome subunit beta 6
MNLLNSSSLHGQAATESLGQPTQARFSPYDWNGGAVVAVAGEDYVVLAADKRLATGYNIKTRNIDRVLHLAPTTLLACGGCHADVIALYNELTLRATMYKHKHGVNMGTVAAAQLLSNTLYYRRFFPLYALAVIAGIDHEGKGYVAGYDAVGSYIKAREGYHAGGNAAALLMPILDNVFSSGTCGIPSGPKHEGGYSAEEVVEIVKSVFVSGGERDIMIGDAVDIFVLWASGEMVHQVFQLKRD